MTTPLITFNGSGAGVPVDLERLVASRMLIQANSGGGKSRAVRYLLEQTHGRIQHLVIDPEGEFFTLRERFDYVLAARTGGDVQASPKTAKLLCRRLVEMGASAVLDLFELNVHERREFVKLFLDELIALPRSLWRPILVVIDEAHAFAPERGHGESQALQSVINLCTLGRKRGFCAVLASQRISKLHKDAAADLLNKMIGRVGLDVDVKRAGEELGFDKEQRQGLKHLAAGQFYVYGPAISNEVQIARTGDVTTTHPEPGAVSTAAPPAPAKVRALLAQLDNLPQQAEEEARTIVDLERVVKQLRGDLRAAQRQQPAPVVDEAEVQRKLRVAVDQCRATWVRELRAALGKAPAELRHLIGRATDIANAMDRVEASLNAAVAPSAPVLARKEVAPGIITGRLPGRPAAIIMADRPTPAEGVSTPQQRMLDALASFEAIGVEQLAKSHVAVYSNQSSRSSGFRANLSTLSAKGLIERVDGDTVRLTDEGRSVASADSAPATLEELHDAWLNKLSGPQRLMLSLVIVERKDGVDRDDLARQSGQSPLSSGYRANLSTLSALGLVKRESGNILATNLLFPEGLR